VSAERRSIRSASTALDSGHHVLVEAIAAHLDGGGSWESAFREWEEACGRFVNRLDIHTVSTFRRRFAPWVTALQEQADGDGTHALQREEAG
jgi:hypothetical protein